VSERPNKFHSSDPESFESIAETLRELEKEHQALDDEWHELAGEEGKLIADGAAAIDRLGEINQRQRIITDRLWQIEQRITDLRSR